MAAPASTDPSSYDSLFLWHHTRTSSGSEFTPTIRLAQGDMSKDTIRRLSQPGGVSLQHAVKDISQAGRQAAIPSLHNAATGKVTSVEEMLGPLPCGSNATTAKLLTHGRSA